MPITAYERPPHPAPHSFLALVVFTLIICLVLNITSLALGLPALIFSIFVSLVCISPSTVSYLFPCHFSQSIHAVEKKQWKAASSYGKIALYLSIANWSYVLGAGLLAMGLTMGLAYRSYYYYY